MKSRDDISDFAPFAALAAFVALIVFGVGATADARLQVVGSIVGSALTIGGAYWVFHLQTGATDQRHLATVRKLLDELKIAGDTMAAENAALDPKKHVTEAILAYEAAKAAAAQLRTHGPSIARVAQELEMDRAQAELGRLHQSDGIVAADLAGRGRELSELAERLREKLKSGL